MHLSLICTSLPLGTTARIFDFQTAKIFATMCVACTFCKLLLFFINAIATLYVPSHTPQTLFNSCYGSAVYRSTAMCIPLTFPMECGHLCIDALSKQACRFHFSHFSLHFRSARPLYAFVIFICIFSFMWLRIDNTCNPTHLHESIATIHPKNAIENCARKLTSFYLFRI